MSFLVLYYEENKKRVFIRGNMNTDNILSKLPQEQRSDAKKIIDALNQARKEKKMGMNVTNIKSVTTLSYTSITKVLSALTALGVIEMEKQGSSKVYRIAMES
jgi:predicted transcriptional regulator